MEASRIDGLTGVWVGSQKIAAVGIRVSRWLTYHGLSVNATADLSPFQCIALCGLRDDDVGSLEELLGVSSSWGIEDSVLLDIAHDSLVKGFCEVLQFSLSYRSVS